MYGERLGWDRRQWLDRKQGGTDMKSVRIGCVVMFVLLSAREAKIDVNTLSANGLTSHSGRTASVAADSPVCNIFPEPLKEKYVMLEGDSFVIGVSADCPPNSPTDAKFEFLQPPPRFVAFTVVYRGPRSALSLLLIRPQRGDAGNYMILFTHQACTGGAGCGFTGFKLKVKSPQ